MISKESDILLYFAHANSFPTGSYRKLFDHLPKHYKVIAIDKLAHNPHYPLNDNWENQVAEMINFVENNKGEHEKVVAVGHSFGAVVSYMSACLRPDLFSGLVMLDPPLMTGLVRYLFRFAKKNRLINKITPAGITLIRQQKWHREQDLYAYFSKKALFKDFDTDCINDYISSAISVQGDHMHLNFDVETEANIFRTIPHNLPTYAGKLRVPSVLMTGKNTDVCVPVLRKPFLKANPSIVHIEFEKGKHMFPLEYPIEVANALAKVLSTMNK
ncbi:MAG: pimeloyl-ACP methyl ester carboxylesterase [Alphaproteobacteria bacterium]|jgi:pimeloyl-ACP methyl ester carboxylesterase